MEHLDDGMAQRLAGGLATSEEASKARSHVLECSSCRSLLQAKGAPLTWLEDATRKPESPSVLSTEAPTKVAPASLKPDQLLSEAARKEPSPSPEVLPLGSTVGRYLILHVVGRGGMGVVYAAYDPELDRKVALKLLGVYQNQHDDGQARLLREAQAMARVSHPNVTAVYDAGTYGAQVFIAMELIEGGRTLRDWVIEQSRTWREILDVMVEAGRGLAAAHAAGLVHRDFKPENVLVGQDGQVHVTDFGLARLAQSEKSTTPELSIPRTPTPRSREGSSRTDLPALAGGALQTPEPSSSRSPSGVRLEKQLTQVGMVVGTPSYMAPEQHQGKPPDTRSDQFSFATTLYYALYQRRPFEPQKLTAALQGKSDVDPASLIQPPPKSPRVPAWVKRVLMRGLAISPEARFDSMEALLARLSRPRATTRWRSVATLSVVMVLGAGVLLQRELSLRRSSLCSGAEQHLQGIWGPELASRMQSAFDATGKPYAPYTFQAIKSSLDAYAQGWAAMHTEACMATRVRGEQTEAILTLRMNCLERRLKELQVLTELLTKADATTLEHAVDEVGGLPHVAACADVNALSAPMPPPDDALARAEVARITTHLAEVRVQGIAGKYKDALAAVEDVVRAARKVHYLPLLAEALSQKGLLLTRLGRGKEAEHVLIEAWSSADTARDDEVRVRVAASLITVFRNLESDQAEMLRWVDLGDAALARIGRSPESEIQLHVEQGAAFLSVGDYAQSLQRLERALALDVAVNGDSSIERSRILINLSEVYRAQGDLARALQLHEEATAHSERLHGPAHPDTGMGHNNIAYLFLVQGELARAETHARKSVEVLEAALGPEHLWVGAACDTLAGVLARQRRFAEAEKYAQRALAVEKKALGPDQPFEAALADNLAYVYLETGRAKQALPLLDRALKLSSHVPGVVTNLRFHMARALIATGGDRKRARELATQALEGYRAQGMKHDAGQVETWLHATAL